MDKLLIMLGLAATASQDDAIAAVNKLKTDHQLALNRAQQVDPQQFVPMETHQLALNRAQTAEQQIATDAKAALEADAAALVDQAIEGGKVAPANRDHYLALCRMDGGIEQVKSLLAVAPPVMAGEQQPGGKPGEPGSPLNADQLAVCHQLDISEDDYNSVLKAG